MEKKLITEKLIKEANLDCICAECLNHWAQRNNIKLMNPYQIGKARRIGIELEYISKISRKRTQELINELFPINEVLEEERCWQVKTDGSIHYNDDFPYATEIATPPLRIDQLGILKSVLSVINEHGAKVNHSCGLHVHIEAKIQTVKKAMIIWHKFEDIIVLCLPPSRRNNSYAEPLRKYFRTYENIETTNTCNRYLMVNPAAYERHGTVEIRAHSPTLNYYKIKHWTLLCLALVNKAQSISNRSLMKKLNSIEYYDLNTLLTYLGIKGKTARYFRGRKKRFERRKTIK